MTQTKHAISCLIKLLDFSAALSVPSSLIRYIEEHGAGEWDLPSNPDDREDFAANGLSDAEAVELSEYREELEYIVNEIQVSIQAEIDALRASNKKSSNQK